MTKQILVLGSKCFPFNETTKDCGGMEKYITDLVQHEWRDNKFIILTRKQIGLSNWEIAPNIEVKRVSWIKGFFLRNISFNFFSFLKALTIKSDLVITNGIIATIFGYMLRRPMIAIPHGFAHTQDKYKFKRILHCMEKFFYTRVKVIALSIYEEKRLKELGCKDVVLIPTAIDILKYNPNKSNKTTILFVGRLMKTKGLDYLLKAIGKNELIVLGTGPDEDYYKSIAPENVKFMGFADPTEYYNKADIFVLPSLSEGMPICLLEAMAAKCAIIATDIGLPINSDMAIIVPPANSEALAEAINKLINDKALQEKLGENAMEYAKQFSWDNAMSKWKEVLNGRL